MEKNPYEVYKPAQIEFALKHPTHASRLHAKLMEWNKKESERKKDAEVMKNESDAWVASVVNEPPKKRSKSKRKKVEPDGLLDVLDLISQ